MAYTKKPGSPPAFDAAAFTKSLKAGTPLSPVVAAQYIAWKQWVESTNAYDGADKGGLRDVLDADMKALDALKVDFDKLDDREASHHAAQKTELAQLRAEIITHPFPE